MVGVSVCVTLGLGICLYRRLITKELTDDMSSKVNELVAKYATKVSEQSRKRKNRLIESMHE